MIISSLWSFDRRSEQPAAQKSQEGSQWCRTALCLNIVNNRMKRVKGGWARCIACREWISSARIDSVLCLCCERSIKRSLNQPPPGPPSNVTIANASTQTDCTAKVRSTEHGRSETCQLICWEAGKPIPFSALTTMQMATCTICFGNFRKNHGHQCFARAKDSVCTSFTCWECLEGSYEAALQPDAIKGLTDLRGNLLCCNPQCRTAITLRRLRTDLVVVPVEVIELQQRLLQDSVVTLAVQEALTVQKQQMNAEYARLDQMKEEERSAHKLRLKIIDEVLTLKCPRCKNAFVDFDGCFAVTCVYRSCRCSFCAWCLADCGSDAHTHVAACPENPNNRSPWGSEEMFQQHHRVRRARAVKAAVATAKLSGQALRILQQLLKPDLEGLGIAMTDVFV